MSIRKALGAVKDQATIGIARVTGGGAAAPPDLDVAIVRATSHDDAAPDDRRAREVLRLASASPAAATACVASVARRLSKTRDYVVAAKCLALLHRLVVSAASDDSSENSADSDPNNGGGGITRSFLHELLRPALTGRRAGEPVLALLLDFRDEAHRASWDHSAFVRAYATFLLDRVRFLVLLLPAPPRLTDMDVDALLGRARQLRHLLDRVLACRPAGTAGDSRVVRAAVRELLLGDGARVHEDVAVVLALLLDRFFDMDYPDCVKAFETYVAVAKQVDALRDLFEWCAHAGVARADEFPAVARVEDNLLETMEQFLRDRAGAGAGAGAGRASASPPRSGSSAARVSDLNDARGGDVVDDMNGVKALPAPERSASGDERVRPAVVVPNTKQADLVDLREAGATADEQGNKLAIALFAAAPPRATSGGGGDDWVTFASDSDAAAAETEVTSAWQTPAAEPGKADWEVALVDTASKLSRQAASLGGGMDALVLGGMYDHGAARQHAQSAAASGSASSVALQLPGRRQVAPMLMLTGPDGGGGGAVEKGAVGGGGDPFAASLAVPPPAYVQMAEMERKQQLLVQEQQMWAQYRQGGMQGQPAAAGFNAVHYGGGGGGYGMPTPMAYNQVGGYY